jgi:hypothetical protein
VGTAEPGPTEYRFSAQERGQGGRAQTEGSALLRRGDRNVSIEPAQTSLGCEFRGRGHSDRGIRVLPGANRAHVPKNSAHDGKFRSITVETSDMKLSIRAKSGYWAEDAAQ